jgi:lipoprotein signal peptidase
MIRDVPRVIGLATAAFALGLDQVTKQIALSSLAPGVAVPIAPFFTVRLGFNEGVSFGMFADWFSGRPLVLAAITMGITLLLAIWLWRTRNRRQALALGAILGGALSNVFDRLRIGAVVDYLDFHVWGYHWPAFNFADAAIVCGVAILVVGDVFRPGPTIAR